jgi:hypothetical protein
MAVCKKTKCSKNITTSIAVPFKMYPNLDFWFENIPSGNLVHNNSPQPKCLSLACILKGLGCPCLMPEHIPHPPTPRFDHYL